MRSLSKTRYVVAAVLTAIIFLFGMTMGFVVEGKRVAYIENVAKQQRLDYLSLQLQSDFIAQQAKEENCDILSKTFDTYVKELADAGERLEIYEQQASIDKEDFRRLKREYTQQQLNFFLLAKKVRDSCDKTLSTILYFYSTKEDCPICEEQAFILSYLKKNFKENVLIFSLDVTLTEEKMIALLERGYDVRIFPTVVIDENVFHGFTEKEKVLPALCSRLAGISLCREG